MQRLLFPKKYHSITTKQGLLNTEKRNQTITGIGRRDDLVANLPRFLIVCKLRQMTSTRSEVRSALRHFCILAAKVDGPLLTAIANHKNPIKNIIQINQWMPGTL